MHETFKILYLMYSNERVTHQKGEGMLFVILIFGLSNIKYDCVTARVTVCHTDIVTKNQTRVSEVLQKILFFKSNPWR